MIQKSQLEIEIFAQPISNPDEIADKESMRAVMAINEKLEQEKEKNLMNSTSCWWWQYIKMLNY